MKKLLALIVGLAIAGMAPSVWGLSFDLEGLNDPSLTATVDFKYESSTGKVIIDIINTYSGPYVDPRITAFAFNVPDGVTGLDSFPGPSGWNGVFDPDSIKSRESLGFFDIAGVTKKDLTGGKVADGIPPSNTFNFEFVLTGTDLHLLNETHFLSELSFPKNPNDDLQFFALRWQQTGLDGEGSDVGIPVSEPVPEPATLSRDTYFYEVRGRQVLRFLSMGCF